MSRARKTLLSALVVGIAAAVIGVGSYSLYSQTTANASNAFVSKIALGDNDASESMFTLSSADLNQPRCIRITYQGRIDAQVRLFGSISGAAAPYLKLTITRGSVTSPSFPSCAGFTGDSANYTGDGAGVIYSGPLSDYPSSYDNGIRDPVASSPENWSDAEAHAYRFSIARIDIEQAPAGGADATFSWGAKSE